MNFTVSALTLALVATVVNAADAKSNSLPEVMRSKFAQRSLASKKRHAAPAQPADQCFTKAEFELEEDSPECAASYEDWETYCDANEQADGTYPKECDDLLAKYIEAVEKAFPDIDWEDEGSSESESEHESEHEDEALIMKSSKKFVKRALTKKRHAAPAQPADVCFSEASMLAEEWDPVCKESADAWDAYCAANVQADGTFPQECNDLEARYLEAFEKALEEALADWLEEMENMDWSMKRSNKLVKRVLTKLRQAAPAQPDEVCFTKAEFEKEEGSPQCAASFEDWETYCDAKEQADGTVPKECEDLLDKYIDAIEAAFPDIDWEDLTSAPAQPADECWADLLFSDSSACQENWNEWEAYCQPFRNEDGSTEEPECAALEERITEIFENMDWTMKSSNKFANKGALIKKVLSKKRHAAPAQPTDECWADLFSQSSTCQDNWNNWEAYCQPFRNEDGSNSDTECAALDAKVQEKIAEIFSNIDWTMKSSNKFANRALIKEVLSKKRQAAPAQPADQCFLEHFDAVQTPACKASWDAWDVYCKAHVTQIEGQEPIFDQPCTDLHTKYAKSIEEQSKARGLKMMKSSKKHAAPAFDAECADWELLFTVSDESTRCWDQIDAIGAYCSADNYANSESEDCQAYIEAIFGDDSFGESVAMRKSLTALKAMKNQVSLIGKVETTDSSSFAGVAVGSAAGLVIGAAGAIIAARSCNLKTDDTFRRI